MPVVINELEVAARTAPAPDSGVQPPSGSQTAASPETIRRIAEALRKEAERARRLRAY
jgi:hypothetical protein